MKKEEKVLKVIYKLVQGDSSPVHLPVSPVAVSETADMAIDQVQACCKTLETHGYLMSSKGPRERTYYYITKAGLSEAVNPTLPLYVSSSSTPQNRTRA
ncbi:hypothetical protein [Rufibacter latericius]|uniref:MarR family transcriptional regulator n=1 Tax=Rufibacter latericius TaxID=2487040 RepID=A0A3M9M9E7_9BACT|nr:hypothetical protein [Rufibacter latericius]RNI21835.1 hypothetical protein EFB08_22070 [Rufibacter latericius]